AVLRVGRTERAEGIGTAGVPMPSALSQDEIPSPDAGAKAGEGISSREAEPRQAMTTTPATLDGRTPLAPARPLATVEPGQPAGAYADTIGLMCQIASWLCLQPSQGEYTHSKEACESHHARKFLEAGIPPD